jgi:hypothetical protein
MRGKLITIVSGVVCLVGLFGTWRSPIAQRIPTPTVTLQIKEVTVAEVAPDKDTDLLAISPDGKHLAYKKVHGDKQQISVDGVEGLEYDGIANGSCVFSSDSNRVAYMAMRGKKWLVVVDGVEGPAYDGIAKGTPVFSPDSKRVAYGARHGERWLVVADGMEGKEYDGLAISAPLFSPDSKRIAYAAFRGDGQLVVVDGVEGKEYDGTTIGTPVFSPDSRHVAYGGQRAGSWRLVVDGEERQQHEGIVKNTLAFSPDSQHLAYAVRHGKNCALVLDGKEGDSYRGNRGVEVPAFSPDSQRVAFVSKNGSVLVIDGVEGKEDKAIGREPFEVMPPTFSPDGRHVVYKAVANDKWVFLVDGAGEIKTEYKPFKSITLVVTEMDPGQRSGSGKTVISLASWEKSGVVFDSPTRFHTYATKDSKQGLFGSAGGQVVRVEGEIVTPETASSDSSRPATPEAGRSIPATVVGREAVMDIGQPVVEFRTGEAVQAEAAVLNQVDTPEPWRTILAAKTVAVIGMSETGKKCPKPPYPCGKRAREQTELALQKYGHFNLVNDPSEADLVMVAMETLYTDPVRDQSWAQLRVFKGPASPAFLAQVQKKLAAQLRHYTGPVHMEEQDELLWEGWRNNERPGVKNPTADVVPGFGQLLGLAVLQAADKKLHDRQFEARVKENPYDPQVSAEVGKSIGDAATAIKELTGKPSKERHRLVAEDFCSAVTNAEQNHRVVAPNQPQAPETK